MLAYLAATTVVYLIAAFVAWLRGLPLAEGAALEDTVYNGFSVLSDGTMQGNRDAFFLIGSFMAGWIILYGAVQAATPRLLRAANRPEAELIGAARGWAVLLFLVPAVLVPVYAWCFWRKAQALKVLASHELLRKINSSVSLKKQLFKAALCVLAFVCIVLALTEPQWNPQPQQIKRQGRDVAILLDMPLRDVEQIVYFNCYVVLDAGDHFGGVGRGARRRDRPVRAARRRDGLGRVGAVPAGDRQLRRALSGDPPVPGRQRKAVACLDHSAFAESRVRVCAVQLSREGHRGHEGGVLHCSPARPIDHRYL